MDQRDETTRGLAPDGAGTYRRFTEDPGTDLEGHGVEWGGDIEDPGADLEGHAGRFRQFTEDPEGSVTEGPDRDLEGHVIK